MTDLATVERHHELCDAIHQCVLDENRFLRQYQRAPDRELTERKQALLQQLDVSLATLRAQPAASAREPEAKAQLEKTRVRILQILQLDKENEQLLLRCSLATASAIRGPTTAIVPTPTMLQKIYARHS